MNRKLLIKTLELLEETYPQCYHAGRLIKKLGLSSYDGEFFQIIKYLKGQGKIIVGYDIPDNSNREILQQNDEVSIIPEGIDFLNELRLINTRENLNWWLVTATIIIAISTLTNVLLFALK